MDCTVVPADDLSREHRALWSDFLRLNTQWDAPAFHPEFVCGLARYFPDCKVAILHRGSNIVGYLPFRQLGQRMAGAIPMCDYQAFIGDSHNLDMREVLRLAGLRSWVFDNLLSTQIPERSTYLSTSFSLRVDLKDGLERYQSELAAAGKPGRHLLYDFRRLERNHGPVSLHHGVPDEAVLSRLLKLRAERYGLRSSPSDRVHQALAYFLRQTTGAVTGLLSVMKASDKDVAYLFSVKVNDLLYHWFPTFEPQFHKYSPGIIMYWILIRDLNNLNCTKLDLGPGGEAYKEYFSNERVKVASGRLDASAGVAVAIRFYRNLKKRVPDGVKRKIRSLHRLKV